MNRHKHETGLKTTKHEQLKSHSRQRHQTRFTTNEKSKSTKDPHVLGSSQMGKRNQHVFVHQSQIKQSYYLKKTNTRKYMKLSTETSLHKNNTFNNPNKDNPKNVKTNP